MGADISVESVAGKLNRVGYEAFILGLRQAKTAGNRNIELGHWIFQLLQKDKTDIALTADHYKLSRAKLLADATAVVNGFRKNETEMPGISNQVADALDRGWHYATLLFGETQIRTGHLLVALLKSMELRRALVGISQEFAKIPVDDVAVSHRSIWEESDEGNLRPMDGSGIAAASAEGTTAARRREGHDRARPLQPGPHGQGQVRRDGPDPRPRRRNPPDRRRADAPPPEQPDPHRRGRRRQDRGGRRLRPAHRLGRRAAAAARTSSCTCSTSA